MDSGTKYEYTEATHMYTTSYVRNSKAIGVLWGIFTICFSIINIVVFVQPQWIGDTPESRGTGYFGLWRFCRLVQENNDLVCEGSLADFGSILNTAFRAATVFIGLSVIFVLLCICCMLLFFFCQASTVFHICGWIQTFSAVCMIVGVLVFPAGWDAPDVREVCGPHARDFNAGACAMRWAYILSIIGCFDIVVLAALAFVLGTRYIRLVPDLTYPSGSIMKGEVNTAFIPDNMSTTSRKTMNLQPVMLMPHSDAERYSEYSTHRTGRSRTSNYVHPEYANTAQNFQL